jgi:hypothetical protein
MARVEQIFALEKKNSEKQKELYLKKIALVQAKIAKLQAKQ